MVGRAYYDGRRHVRGAYGLSCGEKYIASGCKDGSIGFWENGRRSGEIVYGGHSAWIRSLTFEKNLLASGDMDGRVVIWKDKNILYSTFLDCSTHEAAKRTYEAKTQNFYILALAWTHQQRLVVAGSSSLITVWKFDQKLELSHILHEHRDSIRILKSYESYLVSGSDDKTAKLWKVHEVSKKSETTIQGFAGGVCGAEWSADGTLLAFCSSDTMIRLIDPQRHLVVWTWRGEQHGVTGGVSDLSFSKRSTLLAAAVDSAILVFSADRTRKNLGQLLQRIDAFTLRYNITFTADDSLIYTSTVRLPSGAPLPTLKDDTLIENEHPAESTTKLPPIASSVNSMASSDFDEDRSNALLPRTARRGSRRASSFFDPDEPIPMPVCWVEVNEDMLL